MRHYGPKQDKAIRTILADAVESGDESTFRRLLTKWNGYLSKSNPEDVKWGKFCLKIAEELASNPQWMKIK